jgi:integrase
MTAVDAGPHRTAAAAIESLLAELTTRVGAGTVAQRRWALLELLRFAAGSTGRDEHRVTLTELLDPYTVLSWLYAAENPEHTSVRQLGDPSRPATTASQRARTASVRALATHAGVALPDLTMPASTPMSLPGPDLLAALTARLGGPTPMGILPAAWIRFGAMARLILDTAVLEKDLATMRTADVDVEAGTVRLVLDDVERTVRMPADTRHAMSVWLDVRHDLVSRLAGGDVQALWVRVAATAIGATVAAPGLPLSDRGLRKHWHAVMDALDGDLGDGSLSPQAVRLAVRGRRPAQPAGADAR